MSVLNQSGEEQVECPLCMEPLEVDDLHFYPCTCGYQICRFCWNRIREGENGLCPACRKAYPENPADFTPLSQEQVAAIKTEKKAREQKRRNKTLESRRALANVRVVQNNLVFVVGLPVRLADPEILKRQEYFGKYGKIHKVVINQSTTYAGSQGPSASAYVTYVSPADALRAIQGVNNVALDGRVLKGSLGTTKYCANFMKNQPCPKPDCMYLHELGDSKASFTKEEMHAGLHQVYERKLHNQLLNSQRDKPEEKSNNSSGNSSTSAEKSSSKDGNQSNFIPTTVVTSSHINVVNSSKSNKKESLNNGGGNSGNKEAWPSLGSSPPADHSPDNICNNESQENGTSETSSPTQLQTQPQQAQTKNKDTSTDAKTNRSNKDTTSTNGQTKKSKSDKSKQKPSNSINIHNDNSKETETVESKPVQNNINTNSQPSVFENDTPQSYLSNELDELESDRHSLLENHDLLDNSDHNLLDDDNTHNLLNDASNDVMLLHNHREMLTGLVDNTNLLPHMKTLLVNGYGLLDRDTMGYMSNERQISQINQNIMDQKELLLRERSRSEMLMRQNEMLARQHNLMVEPKHYMPTSSIGLESASELLGANFHPNPNMLPTFGMRVDNSLGGSPMGGSLSTSALSAGGLAGMTPGLTGMSSGGLPAGLSAGGMSAGGMGNSLSFLLHNQQMLQQSQQMQHAPLVNGFDTPQVTNEGRYLAENMDKFFTDFHKAQQLRQMARDEHPHAHAHGLAHTHTHPQSHTHTHPHAHPHGFDHYPHNMLSAERLEMEHKQRVNNMQQRVSENNGSRAAGDGDDDLDFDPFKETQKAFAELMETEMMQNSAVSGGDSMERARRGRMPPPGFSHLGAFGAPPRAHAAHAGYNTTSGFSDWTQMDPAIVSTSSKPQELFARLNHAAAPKPQPWPAHKPWQSPCVPLPPGFAPAKPSQHPAECIDAK